MTDIMKLAITFALLAAGVFSMLAWTHNHLANIPPEREPVTEVWDPLSGAVIWTATEDEDHATRRQDDGR